MDIEVTTATIKLDSDDIELLNWVLKYDKEILELVVKGEELLEPGEYSLEALLKKLKKGLK